jgi:predicted dehydrogenase
MPGIGVAVIGTGFIGPVHVEALRRLGVPVLGVLGSSPEKSRAAGESLGLPRGYASYAELLADPAVTVVHLASPNRLHFEQCRLALAAGKHIVCEKPLALDSAETEELVRLAEASGRVCAVNYNIRFYPLCLEARERLRRGDLGQVFHVTGSYVQDWLLYDTDFNWRVLAEEGGQLRVVADIGTHWLDLISFITGLEVAEVCADLRTFLPVRQRPRGSVETFKGKETTNQTTAPVQITTEDYGSILLRFKRGEPGALAPGGVINPTGVLTVSQVTAGRKNCLRFEIAGSKAALAWDSERPNELWLGHRDRLNEVLLRDPALLSDTVRPFANYPGGHNEGFPDTFKQLYRAIYEDIRRGKPSAAPLYATFADGHREVALCEAIWKSHTERRWVSL